MRPAATWKLIAPGLEPQLPLTSATERRLHPPTKVYGSVDQRRDRSRREALPQAPRRSDTRRMIRTENLSMRSGARTVVDDVSVRVEPGTGTGFLGAPTVEA